MLEKPVSVAWDKYFYDICQVVASNSKCLSRQIGCILVKDKTIIGSGYNGPPRGIPRCDRRWDTDLGLIKKLESCSFLSDRIIDIQDTNGYIDNSKVHGKCPRHVLKAKSGEMLDICIAGHAERNTLINSARMGISTKECSLYMTCNIPCKDCMIEIINSGVSELVVTSLDFYDNQTQYLIENSDLTIRKFSFL